MPSSAKETRTINLKRFTLFIKNLKDHLALICSNCANLQMSIFRNGVGPVNSNLFGFFFIKIHGVTLVVILLYNLNVITP